MSGTVKYHDAANGTFDSFSGNLGVPYTAVPGAADNSTTAPPAATDLVALSPATVDQALASSTPASAATAIATLDWMHQQTARLEQSSQANYQAQTRVLGTAMQGPNGSAQAQQSGSAGGRSAASPGNPPLSPSQPSCPWDQPPSTETDAPCTGQNVAMRDGSVRFFVGRGADQTVKEYYNNNATAVSGPHAAAPPTKPGHQLVTSPESNTERFLQGLAEGTMMAGAVACSAVVVATVSPVAVAGAAVILTAYGSYELGRGIYECWSGKVVTGWGAPTGQTLSSGQRSQLAGQLTPGVVATVVGIGAAIKGRMTPTPVPVSNGPAPQSPVPTTNVEPVEPVAPDIPPRMIEPAVPEVAPRSIGAKTWQEYESGIRKLYGEALLESRKYTATVEGEVVHGVADNVATIDGKNVAIEAKFVYDWNESLRNPNSPIGNQPFAVAEQTAMLEQAKKYSAAFDEVIYHTNSPELIAHYTEVFQKAGIKNFRFILTK